MPPNNGILQSLAAFAVLVAAGVGVWYFGVHKPSLAQNTSAIPQNTGENYPPQYPTGNGGGGTTPTGQNSTNTGNKAPKLDEDKALKTGSKGDEVKELQRLANKVIAKLNAGMDDAADWGSRFGTVPKPPKKLASLTVDGSFGSKTDAFLKSYLTAASFYTTLKLARYHAKFQYQIE